MRPWTETIIRNAVKGLAVWASYTLFFNRMKQGIRDLFDQTREQADYFAQKMAPVWVDKVGDTIRSIRLGPIDLRSQPDETDEEYEGGNMAKTKKKWSFFKVILFLGILIAVAIFVLDRILPKPYEDEDLDDAWADDEDYSGEPDETVAGADHPPAVDVAYDVNEEEKEEATEEAEAKEEEKKDEPSGKKTKKS